MALNPRLQNWAGRTAWIVGASSGIGRATAARLHALGARVLVSARDGQALHDFVAAHPGSDALVLDVSDRTALQDAATRVIALHGRIDLALYCAGTYRALRATAFDLDVALQHVQVNQIGVLHWLDALLPQLLKQRSGHLSIVSSVAGYRGLPQALAYGPGKAALVNLAEVLYLDLHPQGIGVSITNPGFVDTPLTAGNAFNMPALISAEQAAQEIVQGWRRGQFEIHFPKRFTRWMKHLRLLPPAAYFAAVRRSTGL